MNFTSLLESVQTGFDWAWRTSLGASVLIALVLLVQWLGGKRLPARAAYVLWMLVMLRLIMPAVPASRMSIFNLHPASAAADFQPITSVLLSAPVLPVSEVAEKPALSFTPNAAIALVASFDWRELAPLAWPAGALSFVGLALMFHLRTFRKLRNELPITDSRITALMEECRAKIGIRAEVPVLSAVFLRTPAVFGWWRARILLPPEMVAGLETRELRMVLLHELVHIKRHDVLLNWIVIFVRAMHWFNPLVWLAVKRLRAERELICDRRVLSLLTEEDERRCYGETLLKLLSGFSRPALNPSLVPLLTNKQTLIRRITMIAKYRPASRLAVVVAVALLALLCCLTFTRAASEQARSEQQQPSPIRPDIDKDIPLAEAIRRANEQFPDAQPLTEEEVVAAVSAIKMMLPNIKEEAYETYMRVAKEHVLPKDMFFKQIQMWNTKDGRFQVDWKDLCLRGRIATDEESKEILSTLPPGQKAGGPIRLGGVSYRIRARFVSSLPPVEHRLNSTEKPAPGVEKGAPPNAATPRRQALDDAVQKPVEVGKVYMYGAVRNQGPIEIPTEENFTVGKAIICAGGFSDFANKRKVKLIRTAPDGTKQDFELNMEEILEKGNTEQDKTLQKGDFVNVPSRLKNF